MTQQDHGDLRTIWTIDALKQPEQRERVFSVPLTAMAKRLFLFCSTIAAAIATHGQCPSGLVHIQSQEDVDAFGANYPACQVLDGNLFIEAPFWSGTAITDLSAFNGLTRITGMLRITDLELQDINAFTNLAVVGGDLMIAQCPAVSALSGFNTLDTVGGALQIWQDSSLVMLNAFPDLDVCGVALFIGEDPALTTIGGFGELDSVGALTFSFNPQLTDIPAFDQEIVIANQLEMVSNTALSPCNVQAICDYVTTHYPASDPIFGNAPGCASDDEIHASCLALWIGSSASGRLALYPNPTSGTLQVEGYSDQRVPVSIIDELGQISMGSVLQRGQLDVHLLEPGVYTLVVMVEGRPQRSRFIRL